MGRPRTNRGRKRKDQKRKSAEERAKARAFRTSDQQLERFDRVFGKDKGAKKERDRLKRG